ncbi:MAG: hypothetical protein JWN14_436 [Chthonomonadales bacterium]|nr:hypothetical protein [Chthonomonadales bacterium]
MRYRVENRRDLKRIAYEKRPRGFAGFSPTVGISQCTRFAPPGDSTQPVLLFTAWFGPMKIASGTAILPDSPCWEQSKPQSSGCFPYGSLDETGRWKGIIGAMHRKLTETNFIYAQ